ncbi:uncharacterized protein BX664DRAFT_325918 [Halteromyces radiatus]|uniref:uncharacterized protein n=1 Tax=Halteromyces radiatus TaxID=101107 RepID=UPI00221ECFC3|nr:uncharacterized protein BX664DRAFT_325918 [Halteromyces radiatus]KAI8097249.1 hypothetical protein BX664DRAFT_325918 [Halteromyces radiatus]
MNSSLTDHLLSLDKEVYEKATRHEFLRQVGTHTIAPQHLQSWIEQDRAYTNGYTKMMGIMMSRVALFPDQREWGDNDPHYSSAHSQRIFKTLAFAASNVFRECQMFTDLLSRAPYRSFAQQGMKHWTSRYVDFHQKVARTAGYDLGEALIVLWAMEKVFLEAWLYAKSIQDKQKLRGDDDIHIATIQELINNWTMDEFKDFVNECAALVNSLSTSDPLRLQSFEKVYRETLALEVKFWDMAFTDI